MRSQRCSIKMYIQIARHAYFGRVGYHTCRPLFSCRERLPLTSEKLQKIFPGVRAPGRTLRCCGVCRLAVLATSYLGEPCSNMSTTTRGLSQSLGGEDLKMAGITICGSGMRCHRSRIRFDVCLMISKTLLSFWVIDRHPLCAWLNPANTAKAVLRFTRSLSAWHFTMIATGRSPRLQDDI